MATRKNPKVDQTPQTTLLIVGKEHFKEQLNKRIQIGEELISRQIQTQTQLDQAEQEFYDWDDFNSELLKQSFNNEQNEYKIDYDRVNSYLGLFGSTINPLQEFYKKVQNKVNNLKQLYAKVELLKSEVKDTSPQVLKHLETAQNNKTDVFIVHGHNNEIKINVARTIEKLGLNPIILHEQANSGKTIIEKFEQHSNVGFAIVLLTDDDIGKAKIEENLNPRARQNVILELGYFIGKLGRNKVCPLYVKGVELPSDLYGLLYLEVDKSENWKFSLAKELKVAGYEIDVNKIL